MQDDQVVGRERQHRVRLSLIVGKLDFKRVGRQQLDDRTNLAADQLILRAIVGQCDDVEQLNGRGHRETLSQNVGTDETGKVFALSDDPGGADACGAAGPLYG
jgi:hypothetical protein